MRFSQILGDCQQSSIPKQMISFKQFFQRKANPRQIQMVNEGKENLNIFCYMENLEIDLPNKIFLRAAQSSKVLLKVQFYIFLFYNCYCAMPLATFFVIVFI